MNEVKWIMLIAGLMLGTALCFLVGRLLLSLIIYLIEILYRRWQEYKNRHRHEAMLKPHKVTVIASSEQIWVKTSNGYCWAHLDEYLEQGGDIDIIWKSDEWKAEMHKKYNR